MVSGVFWGFLGQEQVECRAQGNEGEVQAFDDRRGGDESWRAYAYGDDIPTQAEAVTQGTQTVQTEYKSTPDLDYLQVCTFVSFIRG